MLSEERVVDERNRNLRNAPPYSPNESPAHFDSPPLLAVFRPERGPQSTGGYFRAHARNEAHFNRKLCGALKELGDGKTEIIVEGKTSAIRSFARWCKKGPGEYCAANRAE